MKMISTQKVIVEQDRNNSAGESEIEENSSEEDHSDNNENDSKANAGWADSISKILKTNRPKRKKTLVLSKAKKLTDLSKNKTKDIGFELESDGKIVKEVISESSDGDSDPEDKTQSQRKKKKDILSVRIKPNILQKEREKKLQKIATKGVVQLFNAVKNQQKDIKDKLKQAGPLEVKRDKVLKNIDKKTFLDVLMGKKSENVDNISVSDNLSINKSESNKESDNTWAVLKDDFMMGAKMKDWDKEIEEESESENEIEMESD